VGKLGILEYVLVTPSHHRVHHASNEIYLDKNYGDMFIIWDKLFGTFAKETEPAAYGLTKSLNSYSFLWQHFHFFVELGLALRRQKGIVNKLKIVFGSPSEFDPSIRLLAEKKFLSKRQIKAPTHRFRGYVLGQSAFTLVLLFGLLLLEHHVPLLPEIVTSLFILLTLTNIGAVLEQRRWIFYLEYSRLILLIIAIVYVYPNPEVILFFTYLFFLTVIYFNTIRTFYFRAVYGSKIYS
jgi:hypothetical protein